MAVDCTPPESGFTPRAQEIYAQLLAGQGPELTDEVREVLIAAHLLVGSRESAVRPADALNDLLARRLPAELDRVRKLMALADRLQEMTRAAPTERPSDEGRIGGGPAIEFLTETRQRGDVHRATISGAQHDLMIVEGQMPVPRPNAITSDTVTRPPGVRWREVHSVSSMQDSELAQRATEHMATMAVEVRIVPVPPVWLTIADRAVALVSTGPTPRSGVLLVRVPELVAMMRQWFELIWVKATPVGIDTADVADQPGRASAQRLMGLLATGLTDEAIGRLLGVSPRTIRRRVAELEAAAGATNRFQLALRAAQLGWVAGPPHQLIG